MIEHIQSYFVCACLYLKENNVEKSPTLPTYRRLFGVTSILDNEVVAERAFLYFNMSGRNPFKYGELRWFFFHV